MASHRSLKTIQSIRIIIIEKRINKKCFYTMGKQNPETFHCKIKTEQLFQLMAINSSLSK